MIFFCLFCASHPLFLFFFPFLPLPLFSFLDKSNKPCSELLKRIIEIFQECWRVTCFGCVEPSSYLPQRIRRYNFRSGDWDFWKIQDSCRPWWLLALNPANLRSERFSKLAREPVRFSKSFRFLAIVDVAESQIRTTSNRRLQIKMGKNFIKYLNNFFFFWVGRAWRRPQ